MKQYKLLFAERANIKSLLELRHQFSKFPSRSISLTLEHIQAFNITAESTRHTKKWLKVLADSIRAKLNRERDRELQIFAEFESLLPASLPHEKCARKSGF